MDKKRDRAGIENKRALKIEKNIVYFSQLYYNKTQCIHLCV